MDADGEISKNEALKVNDIQVCIDNITSLEGILFFKNLTSLSAVGSGGYKKKGNYSYSWGNTESGSLHLDVGNNSQLTSLRCSSNQLTTLDVSNNLKVGSLDCRWNPHLTDLWLKTGQVINELSYDYNITTIRYK